MNKINEWQEVFDIMSETFYDFCLIDRSVGMNGATDYQAKLIQKIMDLVKNEKPE